LSRNVLLVFLQADFCSYFGSSATPIIPAAGKAIIFPFTFCELQLNQTKLYMVWNVCLDTWNAC